MRDTPFRSVREEPSGGLLPILVHPEWAEEFPWLVQGTTASGPVPAGGEVASLDFRLFSPGSEESEPRLVPDAPARWEVLARTLRMSRIVHGRQVHGSTVHTHALPAGAAPSDGEGSPMGGTASAGEDPPAASAAAPAGGRLLLVEDGDGHVTASSGLLLAVTVADCVPIFLVDPRTRSIGLLHGGWRGVVSGVLEAGVEALTRLGGSRPAELRLHLGPSICGACYEVGPEVHAALRLPLPPGPAPVDLRVILGERGVALGIPTDRITLSAHCTRCGESPLFSHRGGDGERQLGLMGMEGADG